LSLNLKPWLDASTWSGPACQEVYLDSMQEVKFTPGRQWRTSDGRNTICNHQHLKPAAPPRLLSDTHTHDIFLSRQKVCLG
jgi:hypothetical protein